MHDLTTHDFMAAAMVVVMILGIIILFTTKEYVEVKKGVIKFSHTYEKSHKVSRYSDVNYTYVAYTLGGRSFYKNIGKSNEVTQAMLDKVQTVNKETEYEINTRTNYFRKNPFYHSSYCREFECYNEKD